MFFLKLNILAHPFRRKSEAIMIAAGPSLLPLSCKYLKGINIKLGILAYHDKVLF
jgi:hypothetical protein